MKALFVSLATLALGACSLGGKLPPSLLNLTAAERLPADTARTVGAGEAITVSVPIVPQAISSTRVPVISGDTAIAYVKDAVWVEPPARLFQRLLSETISAKTGRVVLDPRQFSFDPGVVISGQLKSFGIDAGRNEAVVVYDAAMSRNRGDRLMTRRFEARVPVAAVEAAESGTALNRAANQVAAQVAAWVAG
jgi:cholesterol transport system auxiliary component